MYKYWVTQEPYTHVQEGPIISFLQNKYPWGHSAIYGGREAENVIEHIGVYTQGKKMNKGEPGWEVFGQYDETKKYVSSKWLTEYEK